MTCPHVDGSGKWGNSRGWVLEIHEVLGIGGGALKLTLRLVESGAPPAGEYLARSNWGICGECAVTRCWGGVGSG